MHKWVSGENLLIGGDPQSLFATVTFWLIFLPEQTIECVSAQTAYPIFKVLYPPTTEVFEFFEGWSYNFSAFSKFFHCFRASTKVEGFSLVQNIRYAKSKLAKKRESGFNISSRNLLALLNKNNLETKKNIFSRPKRAFNWQESSLSIYQPIVMIWSILLTFLLLRKTRSSLRKQLHSSNFWSFKPKKTARTKTNRVKKFKKLFAEADY